MQSREIRKRLTPRREGLRLDRFLTEEFPWISRSRIQRAIESGDVRVQGKGSKASHRLKPGEIIDVHLVVEPAEAGLKPTPDIPVATLYKDPHLYIIDKPAGLVCHPGGGTRGRTLADALAYIEPENLGQPWFERGGLVHRIDRDTSGLIVAARNEPAYKAMTRAVRDRLVERTYLALAWGRFRERSGEVAAPLGRNPRDRKKMAVVDEGGRRARTIYSVLSDCDCASLLEVKLETGRTHQIRVHLQSIGHPIVGDPRYGGRGRIARGFSGPAGETAVRLLEIMNRQALHAWRLSFDHPIDGGRIDVESPLPDDLRRAVNYLESRSGESAPLRTRTR